MLTRPGPSVMLMVALLVTIAPFVRGQDPRCTIRGEEEQSAKKVVKVIALLSDLGSRGFLSGGNVALSGKILKACTGHIEGVSFDIENVYKAVLYEETNPSNLDRTKKRFQEVVTEQLAAIDDDSIRKNPMGVLVDLKNALGKATDVFINRQRN